MKRKSNSYEIAYKIIGCILLLVGLTTGSRGQTMTKQDRIFAQRGIQLRTCAPNEHFNANEPVPAKQSLTIGRTGRYARVQLHNVDALSLAEVKIYSGGVNVALGKSTSQSSNLAAGGGLSQLAVDGNISGVFANGSVSSTRDDFNEMEPWWQVDLNSVVSIDSVIIHTRTDACCIWKFKGFYLFVSNAPFASNTLQGALTQSGVSNYVQPITYGHFPSAAELNYGHILPQYGGLPKYNFIIHQQDPSMLWAMNGFGKLLVPPFTTLRAPSNYETTNGFLNSMQAANVNNLTTFCVGDEEPYSTASVAILKSWFDIARAKYPDVLVSSNQYPGLWSNSQLQTYMQTAQPDMLTFDMYYFHYAFGPGPGVGNTYTSLYQDMQNFRNLALAGNNGSGSAPLAFGGYLQTYPGDNPSYPAYRPSESEFNLNAFAYLTMGAKWMTGFVYDAITWNSVTQQPTAQYYQIANIGKQIANYSPHLSRLRTTDVRFIPGVNSGGTNASPSNVSQWSAGADPYIKAITATNLGTYNNGLKGDLLIGYFKPSSGLNNTSGVTMGPVPAMHTKYFMILNGLSKPNGPGLNAVDTVQGKANLVKQKVNMSIDFGSDPVDTLYRVNRSTGTVQQMNLTLVSGTVYNLNDTLEGGMADLFYWKNAGKPVANPTTGTALHFNNGSISAGNLAQLSSAPKFTIETWVKFDNTAAYSHVFSRYLAIDKRVLLSTNASNGLLVVVSNGQTNAANTASYILSTNQWYHLAVVYDGTQATDAAKLKLYINGAQETLSFDGGSVPAATATGTAPLWFGSYNPPTDFYPLNGSIDEVRVWNTSLSQTTINVWKNKSLGACHPNSSNLLVYWQLNDGSNPAVAVAGTGSSNAGAITNGTYVTGGWAENPSQCSSGTGSLQLTSGSISAGNVTQLNNTNKFTLEAWVKFNATTSYSTIFSKYLSSTNRIYLATGPGNALHFVIANGQSSSAITSTGLITTNQWYHVALVYDGTQATDATKAKLYLNGIQQTLTFNGVAMPTNTGNNTIALKIGTYDPSNPLYLDGIVDEVRVWNTSLSQATLNSWKDKTLGYCHPNAANLQVYWQLDENTNPAAVAIAGLSSTYAGSITNGTYVSPGQATGSSGCTEGLMSSNTLNKLQVNLETETTDKQSVVYPNPVEGLLNVELYQNNESKTTVTVFNTIGQIVYQTKKQLSKGANQLQIDFTNQIPGLYILQVKNAQGEKQFKVIKK